MLNYNYTNIDLKIIEIISYLPLIILRDKLALLFIHLSSSEILMIYYVMIYNNVRRLSYCNEGKYQCLHTNTYTYTHVHKQTNAHTYIHKHMHTRTFIHIHTYTHTHTYIYIYNTTHHVWLILL